MGKVALTFSLLTLLVLTARLLLGKVLHNELLEWSENDALKLLNFVAVALTVLLVGVPEGMPLAATLILAFVSRKLISERILLKHLSSCETMASVSCICTDKTGTLTTKNMVVDRLFICNEVKSSSKDAANFLKLDEYKGVLEILLQSIFLNSCSEVVQEKDGTKAVFGCPTESALLKFALPLGGHYDALRQQFEILEERPFNSSSKRRSILVACPAGGIRAFCTGAAEIIVQKCTKILCSNGESVNFSKEWKESVLKIINAFSCGPLRTLCLAFKDVRDSSGLDNIYDYTLIAVVGISDPVRPEVKNAVQSCLAAGITVRMVTGDNIDTAKAIAKECGILTDDGLAIEAPYFRAVCLKEFEELVPKIQVYISL
jgi:Ca2+-transporting ATPase